EQETKDRCEFVEMVKLELYPDEVSAFTPKGKVLSSPRGATPVDFAYGIHTEVGHRLSGAKINGRLVPLRTPMGNGDIVEILTQPHAHPSRDWLALPKTSRPRANIPSSLHPH